MSVQYNFSHGEKKVKLESDATKALLCLQVCIILYTRILYIHTLHNTRSTQHTLYTTHTLHTHTQLLLHAIFIHVLVQVKTSIFEER